MSRPISSESVFRAIADPTRRRIIDLLRVREATPAELNQVLQKTGAVLTFHLRVLATAGVISQRRRERTRTYRLHSHTLSTVSQWLRVREKHAPKPSAMAGAVA